MARAEQYTWLPLDRWAQLLGICPFSFNQLVSTSRLVPAGDCGEVFFQYAYQNTVFTAREDIATAIRAAELNIAAELGYFLIPDWVENERIQTVRPSRPELYSYSVTNVRGQAKSVETKWKHLISGGVRNHELIESRATVNIIDIDGDGYDETCYVDVTPETVSGVPITDDNEIRVYYPGEYGDYRFEVRPIEIITPGLNTRRIYFKRWQIVQYYDQLRLDAAEAANAIDGDAAGTYFTTVDVYRVYNDPSTQVSFLWENDPYCSCGGSGCPGCSFTTQSGCLFVRDERLGIVGYRPATWDSDEEEFTGGNWDVARDPDQLRLYYYSGWVPKDPRITRAYVDLDPYWEKAVTYYSITLLDRATCDCANTERFIEYWNQDLARQGSDVAFQVSDADLDNPFGTKRGAVYAWRQIKRDGRRVR